MRKKSILLTQNDGLRQDMSFCQKRSPKKQQKDRAKKHKKNNSILQFFSLWNPPKSLLPCGSGDDSKKMS